jgi:protein-S-isoprenylcysteine O-methyltransferase Ste14
MNAEGKAEGPARRALAAAGTAVFFVVAPGTVAGLIPWWISGWRMQRPFLGFAGFRVVGILLIAAGLAVLVESFARFALEGIGTPAPVFPTRHLVVRGFYRYVRNPMYVAVVSLISGQALLLGSRHVLEYAAIAWVITHFFVLAYEEPTLRKTFGAEYEAFRAHVPRWVPRLTPWRGDADPGPGFAARDGGLSNGA